MTRQPSDRRSLALRTSSKTPISTASATASSQTFSHWRRSEQPVASWCIDDEEHQHQFRRDAEEDQRVAEQAAMVNAPENDDQALLLADRMEILVGVLGNVLSGLGKEKP